MKIKSTMKPAVLYNVHVQTDNYSRRIEQS